jgi:shikimate kinase
VVYLECSIEQQMERTRHDRNRPLLDTDNPRARLEELMAEREPLYRELADHTVSSGGRNSRAVIKGIVSYLESMHATTIE